MRDLSLWSKFLDQVEAARGRLCSGPRGAWYRGQPEPYPLLPKLIRQGGQKNERDIYHRHHRQFPRSISSWERLVEMQHQGVHTRLLDWTENLGVALFFAVAFSEPKRPCIYLTNPFTLTAKAKGKNELWLEAFQFNDSLDYYKHFVENGTWPFERPIPFMPPNATARVLAQRGYFTVHGRSDDPLDDQCSRHVQRVDIDKELVASVQEHLAVFGVDRVALFPDFEGFKADIAERYFPPTSA